MFGDPRRVLQEHLKEPVLEVRVSGMKGNHTHARPLMV